MINKFFKCNKCEAICKVPDNGVIPMCVNSAPWRTSGICGGVFNNEISEELYNSTKEGWEKLRNKKKMTELKDSVNKSDKLTDEEKKIIEFVIDRQFLLDECIVTYKDVLNELGFKNKKFNSLIESLNQYTFFKGKRLFNTHSGKYSEAYGFKSLISPGGVKKLLVINNILLEKFLQ